MNIDFNKGGGLVPAIIQDVNTRIVLMLGYMNKAAFEKTQETGKVTFFSRSKKRLWTKGEVSGYYLELVDFKLDCDQDTLLILANPTGPVCHKGTDTCWNEENKNYDFHFLSVLTQIIQSRKDNPRKNSYTSSLFQKGINKVSQKVGEEAVEMIIEAKDNDATLFLNESADLLYHYMILLQAKGFTLSDVIKVLEERHKKT